MKYGVDLAVWAHEHSYERLFPVYNRVVVPSPSPNSPYIDPRAPVHITTGDVKTSSLNEIWTIWVEKSKKRIDSVNTNCEFHTEMLLQAQLVAEKRLMLSWRESQNGLHLGISIFLEVLCFRFTNLKLVQIHRLWLHKTVCIQLNSSETAASECWSGWQSDWPDMVGQTQPWAIWGTLRKIINVCKHWRLSSNLFYLNTFLSNLKLKDPLIFFSSVL